ncbi:8758_t:CDS:1, partial [Gigaspora rosea]
EDKKNLGQKGSNLFVFSESETNYLSKDSPGNNSTDNTKTNLENKNNQPSKAAGNGNNDKEIDKADNLISSGLSKEGPQEQKS